MFKDAFGKIVEKFKDESESEDKRVQKDLDSVSYASDLLNVSEFRFFHIAYSQWYGHDIMESQLEYVFADFMFDRFVPHWVRHFTRRIIDISNQNLLDPRNFDIERPVNTPEQRSAGIGYIMILSILIVIFCLLLIHQPPY